jgi:uncharacterized repeat protein (TIGR01451 family)
VRELKGSKTVIGSLAALALILSIFSMPLSVYGADVGLGKGVTPTAPNVYRLGDTIHYTMSILNGSNFTGANQDVVVEAVWDVLPDGSTFNLTSPAVPYIIEPGQSQTYTYDWVATRTGVVINTFYATGHQITPQGDDHWWHNKQKSSLVIDPRIDVEKYVKDNAATWQDADIATGPYIPSQTWVVFRFTIHNIGDVALTSVNLTDTDISNFYTDEACTNPASFPTNLAVDETKTYYSRLAWAAGQHNDEATARGTPPVGSDVEEKDRAYYFGSAPSIDVEKYIKDNTATWQDADIATGPYIPSQTWVVFRFIIHNTGNVALSSVNLTDTHMSTFYTDEACTNPASFPTNLVVDETKTYYSRLAWAAGQHDDEATARGTPPVGAPVSDSDPAHYLGSIPSIDVEKYVWNGTTWDDADTAPGPSLISAHNPVVFRFVITNNSGVNLTAVNLTDTHMSAFYTDQNCTIPAVFPITTLTPSDPPVTVYGNLTWAQGQHTDNATATGTPPVGPPVSDTDPANYLGVNLGIDLTKYVSVNNQTSWDDANSAPGPSILIGNGVYFKFRIQNTGNVTLTGINLTDTVYNLAGINPVLPALLAPGATYEGIIGPIAATAGNHTNTGNATGYSDGSPVSDTDPANYFGSPPPPAIDIEKHTNGVDADSPPGPYIGINSSVTWTYIITNTGGVNLTNIVVKDDNGTPGNPGDDFNPIPVDVSPADGYNDGDTDKDNQLDLTETWIYQAIGTATAGYYANIGYVTGTAPGGDPVVSDSDPSHYYTQLPVGWETYPVNKMRVLLPWIGLLAAIIAGASLLVLRRRRQS